MLQSLADPAEIREVAVVFSQVDDEPPRIFARLNFEEHSKDLAR
jgi:hypothetical protein